jgi:hypothetical protein
MVGSFRLRDSSVSGTQPPNTHVAWDLGETVIVGERADKSAEGTLR